VGKMQRDKGKTGELEVRDLLRRFGFEARRGQQFRGGPGSPDVVHSIEGFHMEVKRTEILSLYPAMDQATRDKAPGEIPVVFHRRSHKPWLVILDAEEFLMLLRRRVAVKAIT